LPRRYTLRIKGINPLKQRTARRQSTLWVLGLLLSAALSTGADSFAATIPDETNPTSAETKLLELAKDRFKGDIRTAEATLFRAVANGDDADCREGTLENRSIRADRLKWLCTDGKASVLVTYRGIQISGAIIEGTVNLEWATITFPLRASGCVFTGTINLRNSRLFTLQLLNTEIQDLEAEGVDVKNDVLLQDRFRTRKEVEIRGATIGGDLDCDGGQFLNTGGTAIDIDSAKISGRVFLRKDFIAEGEVRILNATIGGDLDCEGGQFLNTGGTAIDIDSAKISGRVFLRKGMKSRGRVWAPLVTIGGDLDCRGAEFLNNGGIALAFDSAKIGGRVFLKDGFKAEGEVRIESATLGGDLICDGGKFFNNGRDALNADSAVIAGNAYLRDGFGAEGRVTFKDGRIGRDFVLTKIDWRDKMVLDLQSAKVGTLLNDKNSWPKSGNLRLHGFVYDAIDANARPEGGIQVEWLHRQPDQFLAQPYERLAETLRSMGLEEEARKVMIEKNKDAGRHAIVQDWRARRYPKLLWDFFWYKVFGRLIGYGYRPWSALFLSFIIIAVGRFLFKQGYNSKILIPTEDNVSSKRLNETYPKFNALIYSLETFVPLVKLGIAEYWMPNAFGGPELRIGKFAPLKVGSFLRGYFWFHILAGWILTTLWVGGFTGLLKS
jgi:hypothetical protein